MNLTEQQKSAIEKFNRLKVGALFMQQGTGKTRVAIELANNTMCDLVVFIVPATLVQNLKKELEKWNLKHEYIIETYQGIAMSDRRYLQLRKEMNDKICMIIADESIFIKNDTSKTFSRMMDLQKLSEFRLILNGTPITKNEWDIYNQMLFLSEKIIGMNRLEFLNTFFTHIIYKRRGEREKDFYKLSDKNVEYLHNLIEPYIFNVDLEFNHEEKIETIMIASGAIEEYQREKMNLLTSLQAGENELVARLRKMEYILFTDEVRLTEIAKHIKGQCIVFCQFIKEIDFLASKVKDCYVIKGEIKKQEREKIIEQFKNDDIPLLMTLGTGAFGLNLQFCNRVMFSSISFNYGNVDQAKYRIKRLGQERGIEYTFFTSDLGIYWMIYENLDKKKSLHDILIKKIESGENFEKIL